jgi:hypothetical protein
MGAAAERFIQTGIGVRKLAEKSGGKEVDGGQALQADGGQARKA